MLPHGRHVAIEEHERAHEGAGKRRQPGTRSGTARAAVTAEASPLAAVAARPSIQPNPGICFSSREPPKVCQTTSELARMIGMSPTFIRLEIGSGYLRAVRVGRGRRAVFRIPVREAPSLRQETRSSCKPSSETSRPVTRGLRRSLLTFGGGSVADATLSASFPMRPSC